MSVLNNTGRQSEGKYECREVTWEDNGNRPGEKQGGCKLGQGSWNQGWAQEGAI